MASILYGKPWSLRINPPVFLIFLITLACSGDPVKETSTPKEGDSLQESFIKANQFLVRNENRRIEALIQRYQWKMEGTGSGLRYMFLERGSGSFPQKGMIARLEYSVSLVDGTIVYDSESQGMMAFELGKGKVINGLEEAIFLMRVGDRAKFIIPSHLAFGLLGDENRIPQRATLIYDLRLRELNQKKINP